MRWQNRRESSSRLWRVAVCRGVGVQARRRAAGAAGPRRSFAPIQRRSSRARVDGRAVQERARGRPRRIPAAADLPGRIDEAARREGVDRRSRRRTVVHGDRKGSGRRQGRASDHAERRRAARASERLHGPTPSTRPTTAGRNRHGARASGVLSRQAVRLWDGHAYDKNADILTIVDQSDIRVAPDKAGHGAAEIASGTATFARREKIGPVRSRRQGRARRSGDHRRTTASRISPPTRSASTCWSCTATPRSPDRPRSRRAAGPQRPRRHAEVRRRRPGARARHDRRRGLDSDCRRGGEGRARRLRPVRSTSCWRPTARRRRRSSRERTCSSRCRPSPARRRRTVKAAALDADGEPGAA